MHRLLRPQHRRSLTSPRLTEPSFSRLVTTLRAAHSLRESLECNCPPDQARQRLRCDLANSVAEIAADAANCYGCCVVYLDAIIAGGFHVPSPAGKIDGGVSFGQ